ncbi:MAG: hypothetical protein IPF92_13005 [Myxococcales bacterium]|nr:hypothetical protein [Myxococcales bacterium]
MSKGKHDTGAKALEELRLSPPVANALRAVQAEIADAYRDRFIEMTEALRQQASALNRIQETLRVLVAHVAPSLTGQLPAAVRVAGPGEEPDLASMLVVADPIGAGYTLSQVDLAKALGLPNASDVSVLVRAFKLDEEGEAAVVVRRGKRNKIVNYHPRAVEKLRTLILSPPSGLDADQRATIQRVRRKLPGEKP